MAGDMGMDDFLVRALIGGFGVAIVAGPLGAFVVWRRMAFFGGTLSHSALLGVALGFLLGIDLNISIFAVCAAVAVLLVAFGRPARLSSDTLLGILAHTSLAFGLIALLYLVTEELLVEAHQTPDRPWVTAMFFVGFLAILVLEELMS